MRVLATSIVVWLLASSFAHAQSRGTIRYRATESAQSAINARLLGVLPASGVKSLQIKRSILPTWRRTYTISVKGDPTAVASATQKIVEVLRVTDHETAHMRDEHRVLLDRVSQDGKGTVGASRGSK